jgi:lysozyme family protein
MGENPMSVANIEACLAFVFREEGGFTDDPLDPGGATNLGITLNELSAWRHAAVTVQQVKDLTKDEATAIYRANYWNVVQGDALPAGIELMVVDAGVNIGTPRAARFLQQIVGADVDGHIGPLTIAATVAAEARTVIDRYAAMRTSFYESLPTFNHFGAGWLGRTNRAKALAYQLAGLPAT